MKHSHLTTLPLIVAAAVVAAFAGCGDSDRQVAEIARQAAHEQAEQNQRISEANKTVAEGSQRLVEAEAKARRELIDLQQDLRQDQADIGQQRDALESERKTLHVERQRDSILGSLILGAGVLLACLAPLVLAGMALWHLRQPPTEDEVSEVLTQELVQILTESPSCEALPSPVSRPELPAADRP